MQTKKQQIQAYKQVKLSKQVKTELNAKKSNKKCEICKIITYVHIFRNFALKNKEKQVKTTKTKKTNTKTN